MQTVIECLAGKMNNKRLGEPEWILKVGLLFLFYNRLFFLLLRQLIVSHLRN